MSLIQTINRAGKRLFIHFHDEAEFKEIEHPRAKSGQFTKKGTGGGTGGGVKPKAAPGAVVVNPVAKVLKEHGYEKQKGSNVYKHPTGHEVEVHAAAEGQKWLTGWTHGTTGNTGSGAGKLDKHLQSLPHGLPSQTVKQEPDPFEKKMAELSSYKPKPPPKTLADYPPMNFGGPGAAFLKQPIQAKPGVQHPLPKVHAALSGMLGFVPTGKTAHTTTYEHPDKGKVVVRNKTYKSGAHKGQAYWEYFANSGDIKPTKIGYGINNGQLQQSIQAHTPSQQPAPTPEPISEHITKPSWSKYQNEEYSTWPGVNGGDPDTAIRHYNGDPNHATESLIIGTGLKNKGQWQLWTKEGGVEAIGTGQESLNQAFEKLHPRGEGGKFVAKPGSKEEKLAQKVDIYAQPLMEQGWKPYGEDENNVWFEKGNSGIEVGKELDPDTGNINWTLSAPYQEIMTGQGKANLLNKLKEIEGGEAPSTTGGAATVVKHEPDYGQWDFAPDLAKNTIYENATTTEFSNGLHLVKSKESDKWEIIDNDGNSVHKGDGQIELDNIGKKLGLPIGLSGGKPQVEAEYEELFQQLGSPKDVGGYTFPHKEGGSYVTEEATQQELSNGMKLIQSKKSGKWEITDPVGGTEYYGSTPQKLYYVLKNNLNLPAETPSPSTSNAVASLFSPFKAKGFDISSDSGSGGIVGVLQNDPVLNMAFSYDPPNQKGLVSYQVKGDTGGAKSQVFNGTPAEFYNKVVEQHNEGMAAAGPPVPKVQHFIKGDNVPAELNGVAFSEYVPSNNWNTVEGTNEHIQEPPMVPKFNKKISAGVLIEEPDGRVWLVKPKDEYGGYKFTFPKGGQELGMTLQETAIKEAWEESGLKAEITGFAGDYEGDTSVTRYYYAKRTGGTPVGFQPSETEQVTLVPKEELHQYLNKARDLQIAKDHFTPKAIGRVIHFNSMTKIGEKKGSNPGGIYQSPSGKKYYIKMPKSNQHAANELLAAELMAKAGGGTLKYHQIVDNGKNYVGTEWENLQKDNVSKLSLNERKMAQSDFAINAWLANWDAAGTGGDNTGVLNGKTVTLDVGGALLYRAQGTPKGALFTDNPTEWGTLRDTTVNPDAAKLYGDMTPQQMKESAEKLNKITNKDIQDAVHNHFDVQDIVGDDLIDKLIARRDKIIQWGALIPAAPKAPVYTPTPTPVAPTPPPKPKVQHAAGVGTKVEGGGSSYYGGSGLVTSPTEPHKSHETVYHDLSQESKIPGAVSNHITYYKGSGYIKINDCMRMSDNCDHIEQVKPIRDWIKNQKRTSKPLTLFRGIKNKHGFTDAVKQQIAYAQKKGVPFRLQDDAFISMSTDNGTAQSFAGHDGITFIIEVPEGSHGASVHNSAEEEMLFQQGSRLVISGEKDPVTGYWKAKLDQSHMAEGSN